jgi:hypothetical protein
MLDSVQGLVLITTQPRHFVVRRNRDDCLAVEVRKSDGRNQLSLQVASSIPDSSSRTGVSSGQLKAKPEASVIRLSLQDSLAPQY